MKITTSLIFIILLIIIFLIPIRYTEDCSSAIFDFCSSTNAIYGKYVFTNLVQFSYEIVTFKAFASEKGFFMNKHLHIITIFIVLLILAWLLSNKISNRFRPKTFLGKKWVIDLNKKNITAFIIVSIITIVLCAVVLEALSRYIVPQVSGDSQFQTRAPDEKLGWKNNPGINITIIGENNYPIKIRHSEMGLRGTDLDFNTSLKKVLLIGDSFIYGAGLNDNETFDYFLRQNLGNEYMIINAGVGGFSTVQEDLYLKELINITKPDMVVWAIYINDFRENYFPKTNNVSRPILTYKSLNLTSIYKKTTKTRTNKMLDFLEEKSNLFRWIKSNIERFIIIKKDSFSGDYYLYYKYTNLFIDESYKSECKLLNSVKENLDNNKIKHLFFYIPTRIEIETEKIKPTFEKYNEINTENTDINRPNKFLTSCTNAMNINFVSLKEQFESARYGLYNKYGNHWSPKATKIAAEILAPKIIQELN